MEDYEREKAYRLLGVERVEELLAQRDQKHAEPPPPVQEQISLF
jgi:hypothetical protein